MSTLSTGPQKLLDVVLRYLPEERREWGVAMRAELAHLQQPFARWQFAWGCARVALFPPRRGGFHPRYSSSLRRPSFAGCVLAKPFWRIPLPCCCARHFWHC